LFFGKLWEGAQDLRVGSKSTQCTQVSTGAWDRPAIKRNSEWRQAGRPSLSAGELSRAFTGELPRNISTEVKSGLFNSNTRHTPKGRAKIQAVAPQTDIAP